MTFLLGGCYTVIWNPAENDFPTRENSQIVESYYPDAEYAYFYDYPWWFDITPPRYTYEENDSDNSGIGTALIRIFNSGRGDQVRQPWIFTPDPPTQSTTKTRNVGKTNSNNSSTTKTRSGNSTNNNSSKTRSDNGSRKTDNGRHR